ncbi:putative cross-wall-targeting lipoprotein signal domain-containing proteiin [Streptococcus vestibularis]|uniref:putative cross-wall-targeting lipoprotein signal domain-containing proteiin n=1 Tax=Streptococcus vestibularis TaxID=1343 RepID=UPI0028FE6D5B|nr:putative cross-wall-targeting lipoprotein signal domain-containing proteiin [Streptococcus vestibularis]MDU3178552.1 phosphodiester glycosidase family protein [Streptococcus vestibularis]
MDIKQGGQKYYSVLIQIRYFRKSKAYGLVCGIALAGALAFSAGNVSADEVTATDGSNGLAVVTDHTQDNTQTTDTEQVSNDMQPVSSEANKTYTEHENTSSAVQNVDQDKQVSNDIQPVSSEANETYTEHENTSSAVQNIDQDKHLSGVVHEVESDDAFTIDHAIKVTDKQQDGLTIRTITWDGNGPYHLEKAVNQIKDGQFPIWNKEAISEEATNRQIPVIVSGGFWQLENTDNTWSQKEINAGKTGILYSDGNGHVAATTLNNTSINQVFELQGENGWNTGAFGAFVIDGKLEPSFGKDSRWQGDPNEKNGRTLFIEYKDGKQEIVIINGHTSKKTGYSHNDIVDYVQQIGLDNIKLAFLLDGGGSTRGYTKADDGKQSIVGSFVDNRRVATYLYLTKESPKKETLNETNKDRVTKNESQSITYEQWKNAVDTNIETIPGTVYKNTNTDGVVLPIVTNYVGDDSLAKGAIQVIQSGEAPVEDVTGRVLTEGAPRIIHIGTRPQVSETDGLRMTTTYSVNPATGELSETSTAIPLVAPSQDELPDGYVVVDNPTEQKNQIDRDGLSNVLDKSSSSSNATENQNKLSVDMTEKAISSPFKKQRIKEVGILPHTGEKSTSAIATAGAVILTTALGMLGFAKRKENNF